VWLQTADREILVALIRHCSSMYIISRLDGTIVWANPAFCEWSRYSLMELQRMTWMQLSVENEDLQAGMESLGNLTEYNISYTVQKRYIPKNDRPQLGNLQVTRYPPHGSIELCLCKWEPLVNGTAQAFELALDSNKRFSEKMDSLTKAIEATTKQTDEQKFVNSLIVVCQKHPRIALSVLVIFLGLVGLDNTVATAQRLGFLPQPPVTVKSSSPEK